MATQNPNLMSKAAMTTMASTSGSGKLLMHEVLTKVNNAKDKPKKIAVLRENDTPGLRRIIKGSFDPNITWDLPEGSPPFIANEAPEGTEHSLLENESKKFWHFVTGADVATSKTRKETMFVQILEALHKNEAEVAVAMKDKELHKKYKGLSQAVVKEAFGWNDEYKTPEPQARGSTSGALSQ
jgi:aspartate-semialdehyde dehydrogenase